VKENGSRTPHELERAEIEATQALILAADEVFKCARRPIPGWAQSALGGARAYCAEVFLTYCDIDTNGEGK